MTKKTVSILTVLIILAIFVLYIDISAYADAETITFRGLPWYISANEAKELLEAQLGEIDFIRQANESEQPASYESYRLVKKDGSLVVADKTIDSIKLTFYPAISDDNTVIQWDDDHNLLYSAYYEGFSSPEDIVSFIMALEDLYGQPKAEINKTQPMLSGDIYSGYTASLSRTKYYYQWWNINGDKDINITLEALSDKPSEGYIRYNVFDMDYYNRLKSIIEGATSTPSPTPAPTESPEEQFERTHEGL